jgi:diguanylate cyclase (GGDEF)-like protein/PAS domain S-box-containing protein
MQLRHGDSAEAKRMRALVTVARAVSDAVADERRFARLVVDLVARLVGDGATLWLPSEDDNVLLRAGAAHSDSQAERALHNADQTVRAHGDDLIAAVLESGAPAVLGSEEVSAYLEDIDPRLAPWLTVRGVASTALVPLRGEARVSGVLVATRDAGRPPYSETEIAFLQALADTAAATLGTAYLVTGSAAAVEEMRRQADLVDQVSDVIMAWDLDQGVVTWNAAAERVYLYSAAEALGCDADTLLATRYIAVDGEELDREQLVTALTDTGSWSGELRQRRADGQEIEILSSVTGLFDWHGRLTGAVAVNRDVTDQRHKEQQALRDALTGLPNRRFLLNHLREALGRCAGGVGPLAVLFLDLDGFKQVNDTLGHDAGDEVLRVTAQRLDHALRRHDVVTRLGGDEFVAVTEEVGGRENAEEVAMRLLEATALPIRVGDGEVTVMPSIGVTVVQPERADSLSPDELIREADTAMYVAKRRKSGLAFAA